MDGTSAQPQVNLNKHSLDAGSIAAVDHGDEGVPAARPGLQLPGHRLVPEYTHQDQISQPFTALHTCLFMLIVQVKRGQNRARNGCF
jgi:hypothetical protein